MTGVGFVAEACQRTRQEHQDYRFANLLVVWTSSQECPLRQGAVLEQQVTPAHLGSSDSDMF